jgi:uncharacterized OsmC-like protein
MRTPEQMLLSSLGLCLLTTFEAFAARDGIELLAWHAQISGMVEETPEGLSFTSIVIELDVDIDGNTERFDDALEDARRCCLVQNALRVPVVVETQVRTPCIPAPIDDALELPLYPDELPARAARQLISPFRSPTPCSRRTSRVRSGRPGIACWPGSASAVGKRRSR